MSVIILFIKFKIHAARGKKIQFKLLFSKKLQKISLSQILFPPDFWVKSLTTSSLPRERIPLLLNNGFRAELIRVAHLGANSFAHKNKKIWKGEGEEEEANLRQNQHFPMTTGTETTTTTTTTAAPTVTIVAPISAAATTTETALKTTTTLTKTTTATTTVRR